MNIEPETWVIDNDLPYKGCFPELHKLDGTSKSAWKVINGDLPYKDNFPEMIKIKDAPLDFWRMINNDLPYRVEFPEMIKLNDTPLNVWVRDEDNPLPYKKPFPPMIRFDDAPLVMWRIDSYKEEDWYHIPWKLVFPPMPSLENIRPSNIEAINIDDIVIEDYDEDINFEWDEGSIGGAYEIDIIINHLDYSLYKAGLIKCRENIPVYTNKISEIKIEIDLKGITKSFDDYVDQYNEILNGNVDYHKRNFIVTAKEMRERGWDSVDNDVYDYYRRYLFPFDDDKDMCYVLYITPIVENKFVYHPKALDIYKDWFEGLNGDVDTILSLDKNNLVGHIYVGTLDEVLEQELEIKTRINLINDDFLLLATEQHYENQLRINEEKIAQYESTDGTHLPIDYETDIVM